MRRSFGRHISFASVAGVLLVLTVGQCVTAAVAAQPDATVAHLVLSRRLIAFGVVKAATTKSLTIRNSGNTDANVTVNSPTAPFSITAGGESSLLAPGAGAVVSVQFAPTAKVLATGEMAIQCSSCNTAQNNIEIHLSGDDKEAVASTGPNALPISVTAGPFDAVDRPFTSVTICATGTSNCAIVNDVLVDTGSFGLRIFGSQITGLGITPNMDGSSEVGECAFFAASSTWGSVSTVDVKMAGEPTITIPIQVIDDIDAFAPAPRDCTQGSPLMSSPQEAGLNGLLGVGQGPNDLSFSDYFDCSGESCASLASPFLADIVPNPVSPLPVDNNGVVLSLPSISAAGAQTTNGTLYFGIGTESDNQPGAVKTYQENSDASSIDYLDLNTVYQGITATGFVDTGSDGYFFNDPSIVECSDGSGFYCPPDALSKSATNQSVGSSVSGVVNFKVSNADELLNSSDAAFDDLGGTFDGGDTYDGFDWGLPFFFGRVVYLGIAGESSSLGKGPYTAY